MGPKASTFDCNPLLDGELDLSAIDLTLRVVHLHKCFSTFIGEVDILFKVSFEGAVALPNAAAGGDIIAVLLCFACSECNRGLADRQNLLVLHVVVLVSRMNLGLDVILDFSLRLLADMLVLEVE